MKRLKKYWIGMLLLVTLLVVTACGSKNNGTATDNNGTGTDNAVNEGNVEGTDTTDGAAGDNVNVDDILFDTDGDGVYDHTDVDGDGLLEEIGNDANDVVDDLVNDVTGEGDAMTDGADNTMDNGGTVENENGTVTP